MNLAYSINKKFPKATGNFPQHAEELKEASRGTLGAV
jgi:hypothetical protein